ncbi:MAG: hypothetical protein VX868_02520 [Chloroflexota bacterium]|nr:hypothetical protein [Chloroflexota bacterium]
MTINNIEMNILESFLEVIIPSNDDMPSAKDIDLNLDNILKENQKYIKPTKEIISFIEREPASRVMGGVLSLTEIQKIDILKMAEHLFSDQFGIFIELIYLGYYSNLEVQKKINWTFDQDSKDFNIIPFDDSILEKISKRDPFWRKA